MPECYTYSHTATQALMRSGQTVASHAAFLAGAGGPDILFMYRFWQKKRRPDLPRLAARMHHKNTGAFLNALLQLAMTPVQQSYALGFVTHYATDCTLYPYELAMSRPNMPYGEKKGLYRMETDLDSTLYHKDYKTYLVPLQAGTPILITEDLAQVATLLHDAILEVYEVDIPVVALADTFHDNLTMRRLMISKRGVKRALAFMLEPLAGKNYGGPLYVRIQPGEALRRLPEKWRNPYTGDEMDLTLDEVMALAQQTGAICITAAMRYWLGEMSEEQLAEILGDNDYSTGLPSEEQPKTAELK